MHLLALRIAVAAFLGGELTAEPQNTLAPHVGTVVTQELEHGLVLQKELRRSIGPNEQTIAAQGLPRNPQRPLTATTCDEALARLDEAIAGSPLISAQENARMVELARDQVQRLCPSDAIPDNPEDVGGPCGSTQSD